MKIKKCLSIFFLMCTITVSLFSFAGSAAADPVKVAILPFDIHADQNLDFLKSGIQDMLASRLAWKDNVVILDKNATNQTVQALNRYTGESLALMAGGKLKADYILTGSLTVIGEGAGIDAKLLDITGKTSPTPFFGQTSTLGGVIPEINRIATTINEQVFQRRMTTASDTAQPDFKTAPSTTRSTAPNPIFQTASPSQAQGGSLNPNFKTVASPGLNTGFWKSRPLALRIAGLDVGDVNNDGVLETVVLSEKSIVVFQVTGGRMVKLTEIPFSKQSHPLGLDIGDINRNGTPEIFISSLTPERDRANSYVIEFNGKTYPVISKKTSWYYRVSTDISGNMILLGQEQRKKNADIYAAPVYSLKWTNNTYSRDIESMILQADTANILGVALQKSITNDSLNVIAYDKKERLSIYTITGETISQNPEPSGGSVSKFVLPSMHPNDDKEFQFFPLRIRIGDLNQDGRTEIITANNHDDSVNFMTNIRSFDRSTLESHSWNGVSLTSNWRTNPIPGRISDFVIKDFDGDGTVEIIAATVAKEGSNVLSQARSRIIAYDLN